jgi:hypothetical protein
VWSLGEFGRAYRIEQAITQAAEYGARYAITGIFDPQYCPAATHYYLTHPIPGLDAPLGAFDDTAMISSTGKPDPANDCYIPPEVLDFKEKTEALQDWARMQSIYQLMNEQLAIVFDEKPDSLKVAVCSNRAGFTFDAQRVECSPHDDPGRPGDRVTVSISYTYPIGTSLGFVIYHLPIHITREAIVERVGPASRIILPGGIGPTVTLTPTSEAGQPTPTSSLSKPRETPIP